MFLLPPGGSEEFHSLSLKGWGMGQALAHRDAPCARCTARPSAAVLSLGSVGGHAGELESPKGIEGIEGIELPASPLSSTWPSEGSARA